MRNLVICLAVLLSSAMAQGKTLPYQIIGAGINCSSINGPYLTGMFFNTPYSGSVPLVLYRDREYLRVPTQDPNIFNWLVEQLPDDEGHYLFSGENLNLVCDSLIRGSRTLEDSRGSEFLP